MWKRGGRGEWETGSPGVIFGGVVSRLFLSTQNMSSPEMPCLDRSPGKTAGSTDPVNALEKVNPDFKNAFLI